MMKVRIEGDTGALMAKPEVAERVRKWNGVLDKGA
jgi:hypothetical protein